MDYVDYNQLKQMEQMEAMKKKLLGKMLSKEAYERLGRVRFANPELAAQAEIYLLQVYQAGKLGDFAIVHFSRGEALFVLGRYGQAKRAYARAAELGSGSAEMQRRIASRMHEIDLSLQKIRSRPE